MIEILAITAAFMYSASDVMVKRGLQGSNVITATMVSQLVSAVIFLLLFLFFVPVDFLRSRSILLFMAAGILAPGLFRFLYYSGFNRLGVTIVSPIANSYSLIAILIAILLLHEKLTLHLALSALGILSGAILLTRAVAPGESGMKLRNFRRTDLIFPLGAMVVRGLSEVLRKSGLLALNSPVLGAMVANVTGFLFSLALMAFSGKLGGTLVLNRRSLLYFLGSGFFVVAAWTLAFYALSSGALVRVTPLLTTTPLFTLLLSYFVLRGIERVTAKMVLGTAFIVGGIMFATLAS